MINSLQTSVLQRNPETNSACGCSGRLNALLFFREDVSRPRLKVRKGKIPTDTCRHHKLAFLGGFLQFLSAQCEDQRRWQDSSSSFGKFSF